MVTNRSGIIIEGNSQMDTCVIIPDELMDSFKELVNRGINTWDQAPQEIKDFSDVLSGNDKLLTQTPVQPLATNEFKLVLRCGRAEDPCMYPACDCESKL